QGQLLEHLCDVVGIARFAEESAAEGHRCPDRFERVRRQLLRDETDHRSSYSVISADVVTGDRDRAFGQGHDSANDADQGRLAGAVRAQQRKNLASANIEVDALQSPQAGGVSLRNVGYRNDRLHGTTTLTDSDRRGSGVYKSECGEWSESVLLPASAWWEPACLQSRPALAPAWPARRDEAPADGR